MIRISTPTGELDVPESPITIKNTNPVFIKGLISEYSLQFTLPPTAVNLAAFNWPNQADGKTPPEYILATLTESNLSLRGKLVFDGYSDEGIKVSFQTGSGIAKSTLEKSLRALDWPSVRVSNNEELICIRFDLDYDMTGAHVGSFWSFEYKQPGSGSNPIIQSFQVGATVAQNIDNLVARLNAVSRPPAYNPANTYNEFDIVLHAGQYYVSLVNGNSGSITDTDYWDNAYLGLVYASVAYPLAPYDPPQKVAGRVFAQRFHDWLVIWNTSNLAWELNNPVNIAQTGYTLIPSDIYYPHADLWTSVDPWDYLRGMQFYDLTPKQGILNRQVSEKAKGYLYRGIENGILTLNDWDLPMTEYKQFSSDNGFDSNVVNYYFDGRIQLFDLFNGWAPHAKFGKAMQLIADALGYELILNSGAEELIYQLVFVNPVPVFPAMFGPEFDLRQAVPDVTINDFLLFIKEAFGLVTFIDSQFERVYLMDLKQQMLGLPDQNFTYDLVPGGERTAIRIDGFRLDYTKHDEDKSAPVVIGEQLPEAVSFDSWPTTGLATLNNLYTYDQSGRVYGKGFGSGLVGNGEQARVFSALPTVSRFYKQQRHDSTVSSRAITGTVNGVAVGADGMLYVFGDFTVSGTSHKHLLKLYPSGEIDPYFWCGLDLDGEVRSLVPGPDGYLYVGGDFTRALHPSLGETPTGLGLIRISEIGLPDVSLRMPSVGFYSDLAQKTVTAMAGNAEHLLIAWSDGVVRGYSFENVNLAAEVKEVRLNNVVRLLHIHHNGDSWYASGAFSVGGASTVKYNMDFEFDQDFYDDEPARGEVMAMASTEDRTYLAGLTTKLAGCLVLDQNGKGLAAGVFTENFLPKQGAGKLVRSIMVTDSAFYLGGNFDELMNSSTCRGFSGYLLTGQRPDSLNLMDPILGGTKGVYAATSGTAAGNVRFMAAVGNKLLIGGDFQRINDKWSSLAGQNMAILERSSPELVFTSSSTTTRYPQGQLLTDLFKPFKYSTYGFHLPTLDAAPIPFGEPVIRFGLLTSRAGEAGGLVVTLAGLQPDLEGRSLNFAGPNGLIQWRLKEILQLMASQDRVEVEFSLSHAQLFSLKPWQLVQVRGARYLVQSLDYSLPLKNTVKATLVRVLPE